MKDRGDYETLENVADEYRALGVHIGSHHGSCGDHIEESGGQEWELAAEAVAVEYTWRLVAGTKYGFVVTPVRRQVHHQTVY